MGATMGTMGSERRPVTPSPNSLSFRALRHSPHLVRGLNGAPPLVLVLVDHQAPFLLPRIELQPPTMHCCRTCSVATAAPAPSIAPLLLVVRSSALLPSAPRLPAQGRSAAEAQLENPRAGRRQQRQQQWWDGHASLRCYPALSRPAAVSSD